MYRRQLSPTGDESCLQAARHNEADLLREMYLLLHYPLEDAPRPN